MNDQRRGRGRPRDIDGDLDTGAAIAAAALRRFAAQGFEATSLREIAGDAGVDISLISYRFGGKLGLWQAIVVQAADDLGAALETALADVEGRGARERLRHCAQAFLEYLLDRPDLPRLLLRDMTIDSERSEWLLEVLSMPLHRHFIKLAEAAAEESRSAATHLRFRVADFIYGAASAVARRERIGKLVGGIASDVDFAAALKATLLEDLLNEKAARHG